MNNTKRKRTDIERVVMKRIKRVRLIKPFLSNAAIAIYILAIALVGLGRQVMLSRVLQNEPHSFFKMPFFYLAAFDHADMVVQVLTLLALAAMLYLVRAAVLTTSRTIAPSSTDQEAARWS